MRTLFLQKPVSGLLLCLLFVLSFNCNNDIEDTPHEVSIKILTPTSDLTLSSASGKLSVSLEVKGADWRAKEEADWLSIAKTNSSTLDISYQSNSEEQRSAKITIEAALKKVDILLTQQEGEATLTIQPSSIVVPSTHGSETFTITTTPTRAWEANTTSSWLSTSSGSDQLTVNYTANLLDTERRARIRVTTSALSKYIEITQISSEGISITPGSRINVSSEAGDTTLTVITSAELDWSTTDPNVDGIRVLKTDSDHLKITYEANEEGVPRSAQIQVKTILSSKVIHFTQEANSSIITVSPSKHLLFESVNTWDTRNQIVTIATSDGRDWTSSRIDHDWYISDPVYSRSGIIVFADDNYGPRRMATVTIQAGTSTIFLTIEQKGHDYIYISPNDLTVDVGPKAGSKVLTITTPTGDPWTFTSSPVPSWARGTRSGDQLTINYDMNPSRFREATFTIEVGSKSVEIELYQQAASLDISPSQEIKVNPTQGKVNFQITSSVDLWGVRESIDWIATETDGNTLTLNYEANAGIKRTGRVEVYVPGPSGKSTAIMLTQSESGLVLSVPSGEVIAFNARAGKLKICVSNNTGAAWNFSETVPWLITKASEGALELSYEAHTGNALREGTITITSGAFTETLTVQQHPSSVGTELFNVHWGHIGSAGWFNTYMKYDMDYGFEEYQKNHSITNRWFGVLPYEKSIGTYILTSPTNSENVRYVRASKGVDVTHQLVRIQSGSTCDRLDTSYLVAPSPSAAGLNFYNVFTTFLGERSILDEKFESQKFVASAFQGTWADADSKLVIDPENATITDSEINTSKSSTGVFIIQQVDSSFRPISRIMSEKGVSVTHQILNIRTTSSTNPVDFENNLYYRYISFVSGSTTQINHCYSLSQISEDTTCEILTKQ